MEVNDVTLLSRLGKLNVDWVKQRIRNASLQEKTQHSQSARATP